MNKEVNKVEKVDEVLVKVVDSNKYKGVKKEAVILEVDKEVDTKQTSGQRSKQKRCGKELDKERSKEMDKR